MGVDTQVNQITDISTAPAHPARDTLRRTPIFSELDDRLLDGLALISRARSVEARYRIIDEGSLNVALCLLVSGQLSCFRTAPGGTVTVVDVVRAPGHAGLQPILAQLPALMSVETVTASDLILIDGADLRSMLPREPALATALLRAGALDLQAMVMQVCDLKLRTTAQRLGHYLLELAEDQANETATLRLPFDKRLLAARLGCRQENLSRAFATLRDIGVETHGSRIVVRNMPRLRDYAVA